MESVKTIYFDNQATTPIHEGVRLAMLPFLTEFYGNPHSDDHFIGWQAKQAVEAARDEIASLLNADSDEIIFTSGATEANNLVILGSIKALKKAGKTKIITSSIEHKSILESVKASQNFGMETIFIKPNHNGIVDIESLRAVLDDTVGLVSIMTVNNEIGTIQPIKEFCQLAHSVGALFHTDAVQAAIFMDINIIDSNVDMLSLSAHKIYGPKGIGALYLKRELQNIMTPIIYGGGQELGLRSGTLPAMLCVGFGEACKIAKSKFQNNAIHLQKLSSFFISHLNQHYPQAKINGDTKFRHPGNLNIQFVNIDAHSLLQTIQPHIAASTGSACNSGTPESSYILKEIGLNQQQAASSIRFSFGLQNNKQQIDKAIIIITKAIHSI